MKKLLLTTAILFTGLFMTANLQAQYLTVGGGVGYSTESEQIDFSINAAYRMPNLPIRLGGSGHYTIEDKRGDTRRSAIDGNANVYLMALDTSEISIYGLTGLNVYHRMVRIDRPSGRERDSDTNLGFNLGGGAEIQQGRSRIYTEVKYIFRENDPRTVVSAGVRFRI